MKPADNIEEFCRSASISTNPKTDETILNRLIMVREEATDTKPAFAKPNIGRTIMKGVKNVRVKVAIAAIVLIILLGLVPFNGKTALGRVADGVTATLSRLKALVLGQELPETEHVARQIDKTVKILTKGSVYSSPDISSLEDFLNERNISFVPDDSGTAKYAVVRSDEVAALQGLLQSSDSYNIVASPTVLAYAGQEAMIAIVNTAGAAITALQNENKQLTLSFVFHNGQDGCDISKIKLAGGEALLISDIKILQNESSDRLMTVLVLPEVM
ncbi:MAG: hypothetical protein ACYTEL_24975 [Planctomycetota bacterium]|jgi:hypothetical protein